MTLEAGESADVDVEFLPFTDMDSIGSLLIADAVVDLSGSGHAPVLQSSLSELDFGTVALSCDVEETIWLENVGREPLVIDALTLSGGAPMTIDTVSAERVLGPLPWSLAPGKDAWLTIHYAPTTETTDTATLEVGSDDPLTPVLSIPQRGEGQLESVWSDWHEQPSLKAMDILFAINAGSSMSAYVADVADSVRTFTDTLDAQSIDYRIAFLVQDDGTVAGSTSSISPANVDDAEAIVTDMLAGTVGVGTSTLSMLENATLFVTGHPGEWLRNAASLHLIGISDVADTSTRTWSSYVTSLQALKPYDALVQIHGIGGNYPSGCGTSSAYLGVYESSLSTGGSFFSICAGADQSLSSLAQNIAAEPTQLFFSQEPNLGSVEVWVDGIQYTTGWSAESDAVTFDAGAEPAAGASIEVRYVPVDDCR